jgi:hypothetical protein
MSEQDPTQLKILYRLCRHDPPEARDFWSHKRRGIPLADPLREELWDGISCSERIDALRRARHLFGRMSCIAGLAIATDSACQFRQTGDDIHHFTVWGEPEEIMLLVVATHPI